MRVLLTSTWIALSIALLWAIYPGLAQDEPLTAEASADYIFGEELRFMLNASEASRVERVRLIFRPEFAKEQYVVDVPFQPGETISVTYPVDVSLIDLKPYSHVTFSWEVQTGDDAVQIAEQQMVYEDDQFSWLQTSREAATVHWVGNGPSFGQDILNIIDESVEQLVTVLPIERIVPFDVYVYPSSAELRAGLESVGIAPDETMHPELGAIFVTAVNPQSAVADLGQSVPYELAQLFIYQMGPEHFESFPYWLREGLGLMFQGRANPSHELLIEEALRSGTTLPLWRLCRPAAETGLDQSLAQAQSESVVRFVRERFGEKRTAELIIMYAKGDECQQGTEDALGISLDQLENRWLRAQRHPSALTQFLNDFGLWILIFLAGLLLAWTVIRSSRDGRRVR